eukprot:COSAG01_NODE_7064_length_3369_cov_22.422936_3_plen_161_part_00
MAKKQDSHDDDVHVASGLQLTVTAEPTLIVGNFSCTVASLSSTLSDSVIGGSQSLVQLPIEAAGAGPVGATPSESSAGTLLIVCGVVLVAVLAVAGGIYSWKKKGAAPKTKSRGGRRRAGSAAGAGATWGRGEGRCSGSGGPAGAAARGAVASRPRSRTR